MDAEKLWLFEYAQLMRPDEPPNARAEGILRKRGNDAAAHFQPGTSLVWGQLRRVSATELRALDKIEAPEYKRVVTYVQTDKGEYVQAFAYQYIKADWRTLPLIPSGRFR